MFIADTFPDSTTDMQHFWSQMNSKFRAHDYKHSALSLHSFIISGFRIKTGATLMSKCEQGKTGRVGGQATEF
jgi:hypothetical protein